MGHKYWAIILFSLIFKLSSAQFNDHYLQFSSMPLDLKKMSSKSIFEENQKCKFLYLDSLGFLKRMLYSQSVLYSLAVADHAFLMWRDPVDRKFKDYFSWHIWEKTWHAPPVDDGDSWEYNLALHPYMGSLSYLAYRNRGGHWWDAFLVTTFNSAFYEYVLAGSMQQPSISDLIVTPVGGLLLGESVFHLIDFMQKDGFLSRFERILITAMDPVEVTRHHFKYNEFIK